MTVTHMNIVKECKVSYLLKLTSEKCKEEKKGKRENGNRG